MKKLFFILFFAEICTCTYSQNIHYQKTLDVALAKAAKSKKLVLLTISIPVIPQHRAVKLAISNPEIIKLYNKNFINYRIDYSDSAAAPLIKRYKTTIYPSYLFIDSLGNLVYKEATGSTSTTKYFLMSDKALAVQTSGKTLTNYIARYNYNKYINKNDPDFLKDYIALREKLGYDDNAELIDEYAGLLSVKDFQNYQTVLFIMEAGPYAYGRTYNLCHFNTIADSIYKKESLALRKLINNRIITNTMNNAIANKNLVMARQGAQFTAATWSKTNPKNGIIASNSRMLGYYLGVHDSTAFFRQASFFYNAYYMNISADSAARIDSNYLKTLNTAFKYPMNPGDLIVDNSAQINASQLHRIANILNRAAYSFYTLGTRNQTYLTSALLWSKRSIELYPVYYSYDTLAHLLYRLGFFEQAMADQNKAAKLAIKNKALLKEIKHLKTEQYKIKKHLL